MMMKILTGIWIDFGKAVLIELAGKRQPGIKLIPSGVDTSRLKGGARSKIPWGPMDKTSESKLLNKRRQAEEKFFEKVMEAANASDEVMVFGPGEAKKGLLKAIKKSHSFHPHFRTLETADSMTRNQKIAFVKRYFSG